MASTKATKWVKGEFPRRTPISEQDKQEMADYLRAGLNMGKPRDELLEELSKKYHRSTRQIERYIAQCSPSEKQIYREGPIQVRTGPHQERLIELVESWKKELSTPVWQFTLTRLGIEVPRSEDGFMWEGTAEGICRTLLVSKATDKENSLLWECLCQHLQAGGYSWLLDKLGDWEKVGGQELLGRAALRRKIEDMVKEKLAWERWKTVRDAHGTWTPFFVSTTEGILIDGVPPDHPPVGEPEAGIYRSYCGKFPIASATKAEGACAFQRYQIVDLKPALESDPLTERVRILKTKRNSVASAIENGLAEILVQGYVPGKCRLCP